MPYLNNWLALVVIGVTTSLIIAGCTAVSGRTNTPVPESSSQPQTPLPTLPSGTPDAGTLEPVAVTIDSNNLTITNNTAGNIYYEIFPQELLAVIEWAPCDSPEQCQEILVEPYDAVSTPLETIASKETTTITVFWWNLEETSNGTRYQVVNMNTVDLDLQ